MCETVTVIRPSLKKICAGSSCQAAVFNHTLYWIAKKCKEGCNYWYDTGENIYHALAETWGLSIIRREINALVDSHLIGETNNPKWGADRTKHFYFGEEQAKTLFHACEKHEVCLFCIGLPEDVLFLIVPHLIDLTNAIIRFNKCICQNHQMQVIDLLNANDRSIKAITKISSKITYKEKDTRENNSDVPFVTSPSFSAENDSSSQQDTASTPVTADTAITGQADVIPIATGATEITAVTQVSQESEAVHAGSHSSARTSDSGVRPPADTTQPITDSVYPAPGDNLPDGTHRGLLHQGASGDTLGNDGNTGVHGYEKVPDEEDTPTVPRLGIVKPTQQTPLSQAMTPVLPGDASESNVTPPVAFPRLSHTLFYAELDVLAEDTWMVIPGRATETVSGEVRVSADTSLEVVANNGTNDALWDSTTTPVSRNKTVQASKNKKPRGKIEKPIPTAEELAFKARCMDLQVRINEWRGYELPDKGPAINERKRIQDLAREYSDDTIERIRMYLFNRHWKWSKPDNRFKIGAQILWEESKSVLQILNEEERNKGKTPSSTPLGGMYRDKTAELAAERAKYMRPPAPVVTHVAAPAASFSYTR